MINNNNNFYKPLSHPLIQNGYMLSCNGYIKTSLDDSIKPYYPSYQSSNGYDYESFTLKDGTLQLFPIDDLLALTFIPMPNELQNKKVKVNHIDGNNRNNHIDNLEWIEDIEEWKTVTYPGVKEGKYYISNHGNLMLSNGTKSDVSSVNSRGYFTASLGYYENTKCIINTTRHKLVAMHFLPKTKDATEVNHIDGNKTNNYWKNLEWVTHKGNMEHVKLMGLKEPAKGENVGTSILNEPLVHVICEQFIRFWGRAISVYKYLKPKYPELTLKMIQHIKHKECWSHVSDIYWTKEDLHQLEIEKVHIICKSLVSNNGDLQKVYNKLRIKIPDLSLRFIKIIKYKECYKNISDEYFEKGQFSENIRY